MSYGIVRVQKMSGGSVKGIEIHDRREKDGGSHTNKDIDWARVELNYDLCEKQNENFNRAVKERITELNLSKAVRKDAVVMAQVLVTSEHNFFEGLSKEHQEQFFKDSYNFLINRYGKENVISATVHLDETTPHMHFNFVPVTADGRLSAKSVLTRQSLIEQQTAFYEQVGKAYGLERGIQGGKKTHLETAQLKERTALENAQRVTERTDTLSQACVALEGKIERLEGIAIEIEPQPSYTKTKKNPFTSKKMVEIPLEHYKAEKLQLLTTKNNLSEFTKKLEKVILEKKNVSEAFYKTDRELKEVKDEKKSIFGRLNEKNSFIEQLDKKNKRLNDDLKTIKQVLKAYPTVLAEVDKALNEGKEYEYLDVNEMQVMKLKGKGVDFAQKKDNNKITIRYEKADEAIVKEIIQPQIINQKQGQSR